MRGDIFREFGIVFAMQIATHVRTMLIISAFVVAASTANGADIHDVAKEGDVAALATLLEAGADTESESPHGTPLVVAVRAGHADAVALLLDSGANVNAESILGTALAIALQRGNSDVASLLLRSGADPDQGARSKPLLIAVRKRDRNAFVELLAAGADPNITEGVEAITALHIVATFGLNDFLQPLLQSGADPNRLTPNRESALHLALQNGHADIALIIKEITRIEIEIESIDTLMASADAARGEALAHGMAADCAMCHIMGDKRDDRGLHQGPTLWSMEGVARAQDQNYDFSLTLRQQGGVWDLESLNWLMAAPAVAFPGTHKDWYPITDSMMRADVVAYLRTLGPPPEP